MIENWHVQSYVADSDKVGTASMLVTACTLGAAVTARMDTVRRSRRRLWPVVTSLSGPARPAIGGNGEMITLLRDLIKDVETLSVLFLRRAADAVR
jgi:hypothetical protein